MPKVECKANFYQLYEILKSFDYLCSRFKNNYTLQVNIRISLLYNSSLLTEKVHVFINE
jgi:hypothetical protein